LLPQTNCAGLVSGQSNLVGAGVGGCSTVAGVTSTGYQGALLAGSTTIVPNVFQGIVANANQVVFNGIPIVAPLTAGFARSFRITNLRANANALAGLGVNGTTPVLASVSISSGVVLSNPVQTVGFLYQGLQTSVRNAGNSSTVSSTGTSGAFNLLQCGTSGLTSGAVLRFSEGFASAFKTRVATTASYSGALTTSSGPFTSLTSITQNTPAQVLPGSESGFVLGVSNGTAGLADFGTRLKATFNNIPTNVNIFVSVTNLNPGGNTGAPANTNTSVSPFNTLPNLGAGLTNTVAALVTGETTSTGIGGFLPLATASNNSGGALLFGPLTVDANRTATAVWEVMSTNPNASETVEVAVWYSYTGNPAQGIPEPSPAGTVAMSFAPTFTSAGASTLIPRFIPPSTTTPLITVSLCQTTLLYPYVTAIAGFDTGVAIANTTSDPFGTRTQNGTCTLNFYGTGIAAGASTTFTTPSITTGTVYAELASTMKPGFQGYVIAVCNFQLAHGYAQISDSGARNFVTGYLALVLPTGTGNRNTGNILVGPGNPGASIEGLGN
jgi:hypothetical protein